MNSCLLLTGRPSNTKSPCEDLGFRCIKLTSGSKLEKFDPRSLNSETTQILFELVSLKQVKITFPSTLVDEKFFNVFENTALPELVAKEFGYSLIIALKGDYPTINNNDGSISSILNVQLK
ncbi:MAG: hypothetical protein WED33_03940 [Bacteroidia bacterium]